MGMAVDCFVIKSTPPCEWVMGIPKNLESLKQSDFQIALCSDDFEPTEKHPVPKSWLSRQNVLFSFLSNEMCMGSGLAIPGFRRRARNAEKFIAWLNAGSPVFRENPDNTGVYNVGTNEFSKRYLIETYSNHIFDVDFLLNYDYDKVLGDEVEEEYRGKTMRELFDKWSNRDYFQLLSEAKRLGWNAILFNFHG